MRPEARRDAVDVAASSTPPARRPRADPEKLQRVLFNLIQNAIRHTPADGSVTVRAEPTRGGVQIEVADTGDGIAAEDRARVFEPFYRGGRGGARATRRAPVSASRSAAPSSRPTAGRSGSARRAQGTRVRFSLPTD